MNRLYFSFKVFGIFVLCFIYQPLTTHADIIPPDRLIDWTQNGVIAPDGTRGIPTFPNCTTYTITPGNTSSLQTALTNCPNQTTVNVPAGTYGSVNIRKSVVMKGAGPNLTIFTGEIDIDKANGGYNGAITARSWTGGLTKGSTDITISSTSGLVVGQTVGLDQLNDTSLVNVTGNAGTLGTLSRNGTSWDGGTNRAMFQLNRVKAINGNVVTLDNPIYIDHNLSLSPEIFWWGTNLEYAGVENLTVNAASLSGPAMIFRWCTNCWAQDVEVKNVNRNAIEFRWYSYRGEIRNSWIHESQGGSANCGPTRYGIELGWVSAVRIENNIINNICAPIETGLPVSGNLVAYNYIGDHQAAWMFAGLAEHAAHTHHNLFEGNLTHSMNSDNVWGSGSHGTIFRNRFTGVTPASYNQRTAVILERYHRHYSIVGNVFGTTGQTTTYQFDNTRLGNDLGIYSLGFYNSAQPGTSNYDAMTVSTLLRWGNWDAVNNTLRWNTSERPDGLNEARNLPASLINASKPSYWGNLTWPSYGPDPNTPTILLNGTIPARQCYTDQNLGSGGTFNPSVCYTSTPDTEPPVLPANFNLAATSPSQSSITVTWNPATDNVGVTGYIVERCQGTGCSNFTQVGTPSASPFVDSGLTANTFYNYHVRARDAAGNLSGWSNVVSATTQGSPTFSSCSTVTPTNFSQAAYNSYGAPFDLFAGNASLVDAKCTSGDIHTIETTIGKTGDTTRIAYTTGYYYDPGTSDWAPFTSTCTGTLNGEWCAGPTTATITDPDISTASATNPAYIVGFTCSVQGGSWKCGCRDTTCANFSWQVQGAGR